MQPHPQLLLARVPPPLIRLPIHATDALQWQPELLRLIPYLQQHSPITEINVSPETVLIFPTPVQREHTPGLLQVEALQAPRLITHPESPGPLRELIRLLIL